MKIDIERRKFVLANKTGGMSGPAIKPVAVRMVYEAAHAVNIPIIGMGGITTWQDAVEMMLVGATAVSVGTANFMNPTATVDIIEGIEDYLSRHGIASVKEIIGRVKE
jgi:dihydroorotate dehydrogenase (NAD+) catalytic subunit